MDRMVLVDPEYRGQGIGTKLLARAIEYLNDLKIAAIKLTRRRKEKPLYEKLQFVAEYEIERWTLRRSAPRRRNGRSRLAGAIIAGIPGIHL